MKDLFVKIHYWSKGRRRWLILFGGLVAGLCLGLLNMVGAVILNREADTIAEGVILFLLTVLGASLWLERNALLLSEQRSRKLGELSAAVNAPYKTMEILQTGITTLVTLTDMDAGGIGLLDRENETCVVIQAEHLQAGMSSLVGERILLDPEHAPWAASLWQGDMVVVPDVSQSETMQRLHEIFEGRGTRTLLALPLFADGKLYGALGLHSLSNRSFTKSELEFARSAAAIVTNAVAKAERLTQAQRRAAHLEVADAVAQRLLASTDIKDLPQRVADTLSRYFPNWNIYFFLKRENMLILEGLASVYALNVVKDEFKLSLEEGLVGEAYRERKIVLVNNVKTDPRFVAGDTFSTTRAELSLPIQAGGEVLGVLDVQSERAGDLTREDISVLQNVAMDVGTALTNALLVEKAQQHHLITERLNSVTQQALSAETLNEMLPTLCAAATEAVRAYQASIMLIDQHGYCYRWAGHNYATTLEPHKVRENGISMSVLRSGQTIFIEDLHQAQTFINPQMIDEGLKASACLPLHGRDEIVGVLWIHYQSAHVFDPGERSMLETFASQAGLIIEQLHQLELAQQRLWELESVQVLGAALRKTTSKQNMLDTLLDTTLSVFNAPHGSILLPDPGGENLYFVAAHGWPQQVADILLPVKESLSGRAFLANEAFLSANLMQEPEYSPKVSAWTDKNGYAGMFAPIKNEIETVGVIFIGCDLPRQFAKNDLQLLSTFSELAGTALRRESFRSETETRLVQLETLHNIDVAILSSLDLHLTLDVFLKLAMGQLKVDAMDILLYNKQSNLLEFATGRGVPAVMTENVRLTMRTDYAGRVARERQFVRVDDLAKVDNELSRVIRAAQADFRTYLGLPLIAKGELKGVLEIFHSSLLPDASHWMRFVETLAGQAAIAVDNAQLFEEVRRSNFALTFAYEKTIEGWSRALDLRDKETEGHTQRVTNLTLKVARAMGFSEDELIHIRRGALLHDIGKMGVPDSILLKSDQLSNEEWDVMRKHPTFAYEMLLPIEYLRPALDIPYCHHERWDGTGYPRGLKGESIPLIARIFAVIDVYDALTNDRPYRKAWKLNEVITYLRQESGRYFDPAVVDAFLESKSYLAGI